VAGVCNDHGKTYALYAITVHRRNLNTEEMWKTYRRYSDFHDFHMRITEQVMGFVKLVAQPVAFTLFLGSALSLHFSKDVRII
jgi:sorting nexin-13